MAELTLTGEQKRRIKNSMVTRFCVIGWPESRWVREVVGSQIIDIHCLLRDNRRCIEAHGVVNGLTNHNDVVEVWKDE